MITKTILAISVFISLLSAQQQTVTLSTPTPSGVTQANANVVGNQGITTYNYWIIAKYPRGNASHSQRVEITNAPNTLTGSNYVRVNWQPVTGAIGYDVIKSVSSTFPASGNILLVGNTTSLTVNDTGQTLTSYTVTVIPPASETWYIDNQNCASPIAQMPSVYGTTSLVCTPPFLKSALNLNDLPNKATALANLGAATLLSNIFTGDQTINSQNLNVTSSNTVSTNINLTNTSPGGHGYQFFSTGSANSNGVGAFGVYDGTVDATPLAIMGSTSNNIIATSAEGLLGFSATSRYAKSTNVDTYLTRVSTGVMRVNSTSGNSTFQFNNPTSNAIPYINASGTLVNNDTNGPSYSGNTFVANHLSGNTNNKPTYAFGVGAGTSPTMTQFRGTDVSGYAVFTTGTAPTANGTVLTITFAQAYTGAENCLVNVGNPNQSNLLYNSGNGNAFFYVAANGTLTASTSYVIYWLCSQIPLN